MDNNLFKTYTCDDGPFEYVNAEGFKEMFQNKSKIKKLLFGRKDVKSESLFEEILSKYMLKDGEW